MVKLLNIKDKGEILNTGRKKKKTESFQQDRLISDCLSARTEARRMERYMRCAKRNITVNQNSVPTEKMFQNKVKHRHSQINKKIGESAILDTQWTKL